VDLLPALRVAVERDVAGLAAELLPPRVVPEPDPRAAGVRADVDPLPERGAARPPDRESGRAEAEVFPAMWPRYPVSHTNHIRHTGRRLGDRGVSPWARPGDMMIHGPSLDT